VADDLSEEELLSLVTAAHATTRSRPIGDPLGSDDYLRDRRSQSEPTMGIREGALRCRSAASGLAGEVGGREPPPLMSCVLSCFIRVRRDVGGLASEPDALVHGEHGRAHGTVGLDVRADLAGVRAQASRRSSCSPTRCSWRTGRRAMILRRRW
jgi:hypothetical protein